VTADPDFSEKENVDKLPSKTRLLSARASVEPAPSTNSRVSTRSQSTLPEFEVPASGDEDESDSPPPVKKARPSLEPEDLKNDEDGQ
jgi:structural maintenance of chromosome 4